MFEKLVFQTGVLPFRTEKCGANLLCKPGETSQLLCERVVIAMKELTRTKAVSKNLKTAFLGFFISIILNFYQRAVFLNILGKEYLGLGGLFGNILSILSLLEFGIGSAVIYVLYKPLSSGDRNKILLIMDYFKKAYRTIGFLTAAIGLALSFFLEKIVKNLPEIPEIHEIFLLYVLASSLSYFFAHKRVLLFSDQRNYISQNFSYAFNIFSTIVETAVLFSTGNFLLFLFLKILIQLIEDITVSHYAEKLYPFLKSPLPNEGKKEVRKEIMKYAKSMLPHQIGGTLLRSSDNLIVVFLFGITMNGVYANYCMLAGTAAMLSGRIFGALSASVGNLGASEDPKKVERIFKTAFFANFRISTICTVLILLLTNEFVTVWIGEEFLLPRSVSFWMALNFFISEMRDTVLLFRNSYGLFYEERRKPFFEVPINIILSFALSKLFGISGIFAGPFLCQVIVCIWYEPHVLYRHGFHMPVKGYFKALCSYTATAVLCAVCCYIICASMSSDGALGLILKVLVCISACNAITVFFYYDSGEYSHLRRAINDIGRQSKTFLKNKAA